MGSLGRGYNSGMMSQPFSPRISRRPNGPGSPIPILSVLFRLRKSSRGGSDERSGR